MHPIGVNRDLYKWAYKLSPLVPSELVADCFALARKIRTLDVRASPYDLADLGYPRGQLCGWPRCTAHSGARIDMTVASTQPPPSRSTCRSMPSATKPTFS